MFATSAGNKAFSIVKRADIRVASDLDSDKTTLIILENAMIAESLGQHGNKNTKNKHSFTIDLGQGIHNGNTKLDALFFLGARAALKIE